MLPMNFYIKGQYTKDVWYQGLNLIMKEGSPYIGDRCVTVFEILNLTTYIRNTHRDYPVEMNKRILKKYENSLLAEGNKGFVYTYGSRLHNYEGCDQIETVINKIKKSRNTRRAIATTWHPRWDEQNEVPCMIVIDFKMRINKLYMTSYFRSNDFYGAFPYNIAALSKLQDYVADELGVDTAGITLMSSSSHIYNYDKDIANEILKKHICGKPDKKLYGYYLQKLEDLS